MNALKQKRNWKAAALSGLMVASMVSATALPAMAQSRVYDARVTKTQPQSIGSKIKSGVKKAWRNPVVKKGTIGAGIGVGTAAVTDGSMLKGGLVGAGVGAGWGAMDKSRTMQRKPLLRHVSKGALAGAGVGVTAGGIGAIPAALVGAGAGAAVHYIKKH